MSAFDEVLCVSGSICMTIDHLSFQLLTAKTCVCMCVCVQFSCSVLCGLQEDGLVAMAANGEPSSNPIKQLCSKTTAMTLLGQRAIK